MFFPIPSQPMDVEEERMFLTSTSCPPDIANTLLSFAEKYRSSISSDNVIKNRKLGTRTLIRLAGKIALHPEESDLRNLIEQVLLAEFLPASEKLGLETMLNDSNIVKSTPAVSRIYSMH